MIDEQRMDLPSASKFSRLASCPGSHLLEIALKREGKIPVESTSDYASQGQVGHEMLALWARDPSAMEDEVTWTQEARAIWDKMSPLTRETYWRATEQAEELLRNIGVFDEHGKIPPAHWIEARFWVAEHYSAQVDAVWYIQLENKWFLIVIDWKTLFGNYTEASSNLQLMAQVGSMGRMLTHLDFVYAAIIQPNKGKPTITKYNEDHIRDAVSTSISIAASALDPNAPRKAGDQCKLCPCLTWCPTVQEATRPVLENAIQKTPEAIAENASDEKLSKLMHAAGLAKKIIESVEGEMRRRLEAGAVITHPDGRVWTIGKGKTLRPVEDVSRLWAQAVASVPAFSAEDMMKCVDVSKGEFEAVLREKAGLMGRKGAKDWKTIRDTVYTGALEEKQQRGSLVLGDAVEEIEEGESE